MTQPEHSRPSKITKPYRDIGRDIFNCFLIDAIKRARSQGIDQHEHDFSVLTVGMTEGHAVRVDLDNGDIIFIDLEYCVPRDTLSMPRPQGDSQ